LSELEELRDKMVIVETVRVITALPELASKVTVSALPGCPAPPAPPELLAQCVVVEPSQFPEPPTQKYDAMSKSNHI
jgi:hypothetical protein